MITLLISTSLTDNQKRLTKDKNSWEGLNFQFHSNSNPTKGYVYHENTTGTAMNVYVDGNYAYVADYVSGLAIINVTDPTNPGTPVYEDTTGYAMDVYVSGDYA
ncbi:MAG: hypothetical protein KAR35_08050, partial [Candidatus Heimdallarchaeota archaeon]|nr:hypothetical protein [Candidatus Heimdallarchaeota archaeon]MCK5049311.1 hypothetical protein [Candidatus Heimdallarchaeota archaeon]